MEIFLLLLFAVSFVVNFILANRIDELEKDIAWWEATAEKEGWY